MPGVWWRDARARPKTRFGVILALAALIVGVLAPGVPAAASERAAVVAGAETVSSGLVQTADLSMFQPGNIISDAVFFDKSSMTEAEIQVFLESKVTACSAGYTCLRDWYDTSRTTAADAMCGAYSGGVRERASRIIFKVAQACGINPRVILVMLQKEQGLVTTTAPSAYNYRAAMGQGCPDTAACDVRYYGFFNQVFGGAWQLKRYANPPGTSQYFTWYAPGRTWNVRWHPNVSCGSSPVYIQNQATANLYYYTPYQPNRAALDAGYAAANNACSSYGNRNFYNYFTDWFDSTQTISVASIERVSTMFAIDAAGELWAYPRKGVGAWYPRVSLAKGVGDVDQLIGVGDLDGDGFRDIVGIGGGGEAWLYRGAAGVALVARTRLGVDWSHAALVSAAHDFDGDGVPDVFIRTTSGALELWRGNGSGGFGPPRVIGSKWSAINALVGVGDLTGDGRPDLVARANDGRLHLYPGDGRGGFTGSHVVGRGWGGMTSILDAGDIDGDGRADLVARDSSGYLWGYASIGLGLRLQGRIGTGWGSFAVLAGGGPVATGTRVFQPGAGDIDGDSRRDVLATSAVGDILLYRGDGRGGWLGSTITDQLTDTGGRTITLGDFTGDGISDLGRISPSGRLSLLIGRGDGTFDSGPSIGNGWSAMTLVTGGIDFDGDRFVDLIARDGDGNLRLYRGDGAGGFKTGTGAVIGVRWTGIDALFAAGDFTGDHSADLIARTTTGALMLYSTDGRGGWLRERQIGKGWGGMTAIFSPGDFDGTRGPDVLARSTDGRLLLYRGDGRGGWSGSVTIGSKWNALTWIG